MKTIRGGLRQKGAGVSFFSFQDIIMSVTGVVIVIALLLALQIDKAYDPSIPGGLSTDEESTIVSVEDLRERESEMARLRARLDELRAGASSSVTLAEIETEITRLEDRIVTFVEKREDIVGSGDAAGDSKTTRSEIAEITRLVTEADLVSRRLKEFGPDAARRNRKVQELEQKVKKTQSMLLAAMKKPREIRLIPEKAKTTKEPIIVDVSGKHIIAKRFDKGGAENIKSVYRFSRYCGRFKPADQYFVFFFRPSGTHRFEELRQAARAAGFEVGYDAIAENVVLELGNK